MRRKSITFGDIEIQKKSFLATNTQFQYMR